MHGTPVTVGAAYPQSTLNGTLTCSSLSGTASYETYVAGRRNLDVYKSLLPTFMSMPWCTCSKKTDPSVLFKIKICLFSYAFRTPATYGDGTWYRVGARGGGSYIDMVYVYVPAFWGTFSRNLV